MSKKSLGDNDLASDEEHAARANLGELFGNSPIPQQEMLQNLGLYINRKSLSRLLFLHELYKKIIDVHGVVMEFGVRWGQTLSLFTSLRGIYEPYNYNRKLIGFDTFEGFLEPNRKDGNARRICKGNYSVTKDYEGYLADLLDYHEQESPISHIQKYSLIKGDASVKITEYLDKNPETIVALAYFDFDLYKPTYDCLKAIRPHLTKGSVIGFDELNDSNFPGETLALKEILGLDSFSIKRMPYCPMSSYIVIE
ncbi:crotonobetainyl-CoA--carnitine CoA-transferase [Maridesulfovibrio zosterae]|uniref:crotonobetainyl-CoA--carnitine CoA-transferase n=1 Tax=Maridesulfovibrio zosterae TaxID=82171 RepID=UPI00040CE93D|nr:crotonobetainyl-CoA--carnitine CoA-transferase [Maridesulfovibrio zosterae]